MSLCRACCLASLLPFADGCCSRPCYFIGQVKSTNSGPLSISIVTTTVNVPHAAAASWCSIPTAGSYTLHYLCKVRYSQLTQPLKVARVDCLSFELWQLSTDMSLNYNYMYSLSSPVLRNAIKSNPRTCAMLLMHHMRSRLLPSKPMSD